MKWTGRLLLVIISTVIKDTYQIYGGWKADPGLFRHQVAIYAAASFSCGGAIIDEFHILTAAHCVDNAQKRYSVKVLAGIERLGDPRAISRNVRRIYIHPDYRSSSKNHDIAVFTLTAPYTDQDNIAIVPLPDFDAPLCEKCFFAGWGIATSQSRVQMDLLWTVLTILPFEVCRDEFRLPHRPYQLRAISELRVSATSQGDSGGVLICGAQAVGVLSAGQRNPNKPDLFNKVYSHLPFIRAATSDCAHLINVPPK